LSPPRSVGGVRVIPVAATVAVLLLLAIAGGLYFAGPKPFPLNEISSPAGTELADGLEVADGSVLLGPVFPIPVYELNDSPGWFALLAVTGDPVEAWNGYLEQFRAALPSVARYFDEPRCRPGGASAFMCSAGGTGVGPDGERLSIDARMRSNPDDPAGRYVIELWVDRPPTEQQVGAFDRGYPSRLAGDDAPEPHKARRPPRAGELLARRLMDDRRYVLLKGTQLAAVTGDASIFGVLIKVDPGSDVDRVARAYAAQSEGPNNPVRTLVRVERFGAVTTLMRVSSLAGSNDATVWAVDQPKPESDYIFYRVFRG
jgi:hypothetical protein